MKDRKFAILLILFLSVCLLNPERVWSTATPNFSSCLNPQGSLKVKYDSGNHGIVGKSSLVTGSDSVYSQDGNSLIQCFCAEDGSGIQTNWWKISGLSENEIESLKKEGWVYIADGSAWGLEQGPYLASNSDYSCKSKDTGRGGNSDSSSSSGGEVAGSSNIGQVLGLAFTGGVGVIYSLFALSALFGLLALFAPKK